MSAVVQRMELSQVVVFVFGDFVEALLGAAREQEEQDRAGGQRNLTYPHRRLNMPEPHTATTVCR